MFIHLNQALKLPPVLINEQIKARIALRDQFVGRLYAGIVTDEIIKLRERYVYLTGKYDCN